MRLRLLRDLERVRRHPVPHRLLDLLRSRLQDLASDVHRDALRAAALADGPDDDAKLELLVAVRQRLDERVGADHLPPGREGHGHRNGAAAQRGRHARGHGLLGARVRAEHDGGGVGGRAVPGKEVGALAHRRDVGGLVGEELCPADHGVLLVGEHGVAGRAGREKLPRLHGGVARSQHLAPGEAAPAALQVDVGGAQHDAALHAGGNAASGRAHHVHDELAAARDPGLQGERYAKAGVRRQAQRAGATHALVGNEVAVALPAARPQDPGSDVGPRGAPVLGRDAVASLHENLHVDVLVRRCGVQSHGRNHDGAHERQGVHGGHAVERRGLELREGLGDGERPRAARLHRGEEPRGAREQLPDPGLVARQPDVERVGGVVRVGERAGLGRGAAHDLKLLGRGGQRLDRPGWAPNDERVLRQVFDGRVHALGHPHGHAPGPSGGGAARRVDRRERLHSLLRTDAGREPP
mmetsp:Transcript_6226/g.25912  ORF Transcript_6226/g.25912 Transcript_6226/m.25912 type:complete len:468 (+) Transcript_6226:639-2042(+)